MIKPIDFPGRNSFVFIPELMQQGVELPSFTDGRQVTTCWQFTPEALELLTENKGTFYVTVVQHRSVVPLAMAVESPLKSAPSLTIKQNT